MRSQKIEMILSVARTMFGKYGLKKTSLDEIARLARVAKGTIYNYFGSKDRVYLEVLKTEIEEFISKIREHIGLFSSPEEKIKVHITSRFKFLKRENNLLYIEKEGDLLPSHILQLKKELWEREIELVKSILEEGIEKGIFCIKDPKIVARTIIHALKGFEIAHPIKEWGHELDTYLSTFIETIFSGIMCK